MLLASKLAVTTTLTDFPASTLIAENVSSGSLASIVATSSFQILTVNVNSSSDLTLVPAIETLLKLISDFLAV
ncbi:hypothetical protein IKO50_06365 [bacterium]|nr:hypothetical protein [bacterium]